MSIWLASWGCGDCQYHAEALVESGSYEQVVIECEEANGDVIRAMWKRLDEFGEEKSILYSPGLLEMLTK